MPVRFTVPSAVEALPVAGVLSALGSALHTARAAILEAPPGAGKSTVVPLALLDAPWLAGQRIVVLEPRRLAARAVATRMASLLGEEPGATVGYRTRLERRIGPGTRIEVVTEGILTRRLQADPALDGTGLVIFDEFHERNLQADLGLALVLDARRHVAPDLRVLLMSATLDAAPLVQLLGGAPLLGAPGLSHPVATRYLERVPPDGPIRAVAGAVRRVLEEHAGDVLVFLPGGAEIRRVERELDSAPLPTAISVLPLYGDLGREAQDQAIAPASPGRRKVVLATNIAETSLTIEGVRVVIDSGLERRSRFDPRSGMNRLETQRISISSADQRRGRAGRVGPGTCYRLWTEREQRALVPHMPPEIETSDLAPLALDLACWGVADPAALAWLSPPPPGPLAQARDLLTGLGALADDGRITPHGREMQQLGAHPRLAHLLLRARELELAATGCALAALLEERDVIRGRTAERDPDLRTRMELIAGGRCDTGEVDHDALRRVRRTAGEFARRLGTTNASTRIDSGATGELLALAYPDRVGRARAPDSGTYLLSSGRAARFAAPTALARAEWLVIPTLDAGEREARIHLAAPLTASELEQVLGDRMTTVERVAWDLQDNAVVSRRERRLGELLVESSALSSPDPESLRAAMLVGIRQLGLAALPWTPELRQWQARVRLLRAQGNEAWPEVGDDALLASLEHWLAPWLDGVSRATHLARVDLAAALKSQLNYAEQQRLEREAPTHLAVPSGSRIPLDYLDGTLPSLSVRLQEVFGLTSTPRIANGRIPLRLKLLSPARRPVQVTQDLASFWAGMYHEVRKELKGRYPKHYWPEDPLVAEPRRGTRR